MSDDPFAAFDEIGISYEEALGHFISMYSKAESALKAVLVRETRVSGVIARAIFSGTRSDQASQFIRRCYEARAKPLPTGLAEALEHLAIITALRNDILHYGVEVEGGELISGNRDWVAQQQKARERVIEVTTLHQAYIDAYKIGSLLARYAGGRPRDLKDVDKLLAVSWHYKPRAPVRTGRKAPPRKTGPKLIPQPRSYLKTPPTEG